MKKLPLLVALGLFTLGTATMVKAGEDMPQAADGFEATEAVEDVQIEATDVETEDLEAEKYNPDETPITEEIETPEAEINSADANDVSE